MSDSDHRLPDPVEAGLGTIPKAGYAYWLGIAPEPGRLPGRRHLDPVDIPALLPFTILYDIDSASRTFRYRLLGTKVVDAIGRDLTGATLEDALEGAALARTRARMDAVVDLRRPDWRRGPPIIRGEHRHALMERLFLPLAEDGSRVDMLLCFTQYYGPTLGATPRALPEGDWPEP